MFVLLLSKYSLSKRKIKKRKERERKEKKILLSKDICFCRYLDLLQTGVTNDINNGFQAPLNGTEL